MTRWVQLGFYDEERGGWVRYASYALCFFLFFCCSTFYSSLISYVYKGKGWYFIFHIASLMEKYCTLELEIWLHQRFQDINLQVLLAQTCVVFSASMNWNQIKSQILFKEMIETERNTGICKTRKDPANFGNFKICFRHGQALNNSIINHDQVL